MEIAPRSSPDKIVALLRQSLAMWHVPGRVETGEDHVILVTTADRPPIRIERAPPALPFRWQVTIGERRRGAVSLVAVLRQVRGALDPGYTPTRVRIAPLPDQS